MSEQYKDDPLVRAMNRANARDWQARALKAEAELGAVQEGITAWQQRALAEEAARLKAKEALREAEKIAEHGLNSCRVLAQRILTVVRAALSEKGEMR